MTEQRKSNSGTEERYYAAETGNPRRVGFRRVVDVRIPTTGDQLLVPLRKFPRRTRGYIGTGLFMKVYPEQIQKFVKNKTLIRNS